MADEITELMTEQLRDAYSAEKQALKAMPRIMKKATSQSLKDALQAHLEQTEGQVERLERCLEAVGFKPGRKVCEAMRGLIEEAQHELEDHDKGPTLDVVITAAAQRMEHYEIAAYGTMAAIAKAAGEEEVARLLAETLAEEKRADETLTRLGESELNPAFVRHARGEEDEEEDGEDEEAEEQRPARARRAPARAASTGGGATRRAPARR